MLDRWMHVPARRVRILPQRTFAAQMLYCFLLSTAITFVIEALSRRSPVNALWFMAARPHAFWYNVLIVCTVMSVMHFFRRRVFVQFLIGFVWVALGIINCCLCVVRVRPFNAYDFVIFISNLSITTAYATWLELLLIVAGLTMLTLAMAWLFRYGARARVERKQAVWGTAVLAGVLVLVTIPYAATYNDYTEPLSAYSQYGFAYSFGRSLFSRGVDKPKVYDEETVDEILEDVGEDHAVANANAQDLPNIIVLQLESFYDPANITSVTCSENPVPVFTQLKKDYSTGLLYVPVIGGGTANVEFEVLTGMNITHFGTGEYPYSTVLKEETCETVAYDLRALGYDAHAIHNHMGTFYQRHRVFSMLGFDTFTSLEYMQNYTKNAVNWCRDDVLTGSILDALQYSDKRDFVFAVAVQGHGDYPSDAPETPYAITSAGLEEDDTLRNAFEYYINELYETDAFLGQLTAALEAYDEPVMLIIYGDHLPALAFGAEDLRTGSLLASEYVIWTNDESLPKEDCDLHAYQLTSHALGRIGISNGVLMRFHQQCSNDADYQEQLRVLEYDMLYGDKLLYDGTAPYPRTEMRMGVKDIVVHEAIFNGTHLIVKGENFTRSSVVYADGKELKTSLVDGNMLVASPTLLAHVNVGDEILVAQVAEDSTELSRSGSVICTGQ